MRSAKTVSHLQQIVFTVVKYMVFLDAFLAAVLLIYSLITGIALAEMIPFVLMLLVASVPVALPATFTLATALGAQELAKSGVLITRLSTIEEAAAMDVPCSDKTGTITKNEMSLAAARPFDPYQEDELLRFAAMASDDATQDPIDVAIRDRPAGGHGVPGPPTPGARRLRRGSLAGDVRWSAPPLLRSDPRGRALTGDGRGRVA